MADAEELILSYLREHKKEIFLDEEGAKILEILEGKYTYYEYVISEMVLLIKKNKISLASIDPKLNKTILNPKRKANYITGQDMIIIQKNVPSQFIVCEFIHEYVHKKFHDGEWNLSKFKEPVFPVPDPQEVICNILSLKYSEKKGFREEYAALLGIIK